MNTDAAIALPSSLPACAANPVSPKTPATTARFTLDGGSALERHLEETCRKVLAGVRGLIPADRLEALMLGGGYGRGEGGVLKQDSGEEPYNDLEFYVFLRGNRHLNERRHHHPLEVLGQILTPLAGVEVEFKVASFAELAASPPSMFSYDLVTGHHWLFGDRQRLACCDHHRDAEQIPIAEATRLLMNRCSGLLFAQERLERTNFTLADADFVRRNIAKAQLALGDALLAFHGQYHWSCRERHLRLHQLYTQVLPSWYQDLLAHHRVGVEFKLHPTRNADSGEELRKLHAEVRELSRQIWLWMESRRLHRVFSSVRDYVETEDDKCPETRAARNLLVNFKVGGHRALLRGDCLRHPRHRVLDALALLLWEPEVLDSPTLLRRLQSRLSTRATRYADLVAQYQALWREVN
jgi:hypothetical protein